MVVELMLKRYSKSIYLVLILAMVVLASYLVYSTGGTKHSLENLMYIPIVMAAFVYGIEGSALVSIGSGFVLGPFMPEDVALGIMQEPSVWIGRVCMQIFISIALGLIISHNRKLSNIINDKAYENPETEFPNMSKLLVDIEEYQNRYKSFTVLIFRYTNLKLIKMHIDFFAGINSLKHLLNVAGEFFQVEKVYSYGDQFAVILPESGLSEANMLGKQFIEKFEMLQYVNNIPVHYYLKCGVVNYPVHGQNAWTFFQNINRAIGQVENSNRNIEIFNEYKNESNQRSYYILLEFLKSMEEDLFTLHYQPKFDVVRNEVSGVEALLRWKDPNQNHVKTDELIKIVENAGMIGHLTKMAVKKSIVQLSEWHNCGLKINVSVNLSSKDLNDNTLLNYTQKYLECFGVDPAYYEYELTERSLIENKGKSAAYLKELKNLGLKISVDDYGTGYNSLMNMVSLPIDYIKIDKYFISNIGEKQGKKLVEDMISLIHNLGIKVLAEGVETKDQFEALKEMGCDFVQGYYFSKPVDADGIGRVISEINNRFI